MSKINTLQQEIREIEQAEMLKKLGWNDQIIEQIELEYYGKDEQSNSRNPERDV